MLAEEECEEILEEDLLDTLKKFNGAMSTGNFKKANSLLDKMFHDTRNKDKCPEDVMVA